MQVRWLPEALADLRDIRDYIASRNPTAAREMGGHIRTARDRIKQHPLMQPEGDIPGTREYVLRRYRCVIVYRIKDDFAEIVWVFGPGQDRVAIAQRAPR